MFGKAINKRWRLVAGSGNPSAMNIEKIRHLCHAEPFVPFTIHLPDGRSVAVAHPDFVALAPSGRLMSVYHDDDSESIIDVMLVSDVTLQTNGRRPTGGN